MCVCVEGIYKRSRQSASCGRKRTFAGKGSPCMREASGKALHTASRRVEAHRQGGNFRFLETACQYVVTWCSA